MPSRNALTTVTTLTALCLTSAMVSGAGPLAATPAQASTVLGNRIANIVAAEVGAVETPLGSNRVNGKPYGNLGAAWCAHFVTWALKASGVDPAGSGRGSFNTNVARAWSMNGATNGYKRSGTTRNAQVGDLLIDRYNGTSGTGGHISVVVRTAVDGRSDLVETVGGNESDRVVRRVKDLDNETRWLVTIAEVKNGTSVTAPGSTQYPSTGGTLETYEAPAVDFDNDGRADLGFLKTRNTGTSSTELHVASSASGYKQFLAHSASGISATEAANGQFALGDQEGDGREDLYFIKTRNTGSGNIEVHILNASTGHKQYSLQRPVPIAVADAANGSFQLADSDGDGRSDLAFVKTRNTGQAKVELHVLSGASGYTGWIHHRVTPVSTADAANGHFTLGDVDGDRKADLGFVKTRNTPSGNVELHTSLASSGYATFHRQVTTPLTGAVAAASTMQLAQIDSDGRADLVAIQTSGTATGKVEVHAVSASSTWSAFNTHAASEYSTADATNGAFAM